jgi:hypothetical protein
MSVMSTLKDVTAGIARGGHFQLWMGIAIAGCGVLEMVEGIEHIAEVGELGGMHGVVLVGALHAVKGVSELVHGTEKAKEDLPRIKIPHTHNQTKN